MPLLRARTLTAASGSIIWWPQALGVLFTILLAGFLWLPALALYGTALWHAAGSTPGRLGQVWPADLLSRRLFFHTVVLAVASAVLAVVLGWPVALGLARGPLRWRPLGALLCALPIALPPTLGATAWLEITRAPPARALAALAASRPSTLPPLLIAAPVLALCFFPVAALPLYAALVAIPREVEEAGRLFGGPWDTWRRALWPLLRPTVYGAAGIVAVLAMWEMGAPDLLDVPTYSVQIFRNLNAPDELDPQGKAVKAALAGLPMLALGCLALAPAAGALRFYGTRMSGAYAAVFGGDASAHEPDAEGRAAAAVSALVFAASPLAILLVFITQLRPPQILFMVWGANSPEIANTAGLATLAALAITEAALVAVAVWRAWPRWAGYLALGLTTSPLLIAPVMLGIALINFWNRPCFALVYGGLPPTGNPLLDWVLENVARYGMMLIGYLARFLPLAVLLLYGAARRVDDALLEAARNLGATPARAARTILAPLLAPSLLAVGALVWALCAGELTTSVLINAPGGQTLPIPIFNFMHIGATAEVAALSLTLAAMSGGAMFIAAALLRLWRSRVSR